MATKKSQARATSADDAPEETYMTRQKRLAMIAQVLDEVLPPEALKKKMSEGLNAMKVDSRQDGAVETEDLNMRKSYLTTWLQMQSKVAEEMEKAPPEDDERPLTFEELEERLKNNPAARRKMMLLLQRLEEEPRNISV